MLQSVQFSQTGNLIILFSSVAQLEIFCQGSKWAAYYDAVFSLQLIWTQQSCIEISVWFYHLKVYIGVQIWKYMSSIFIILALTQGTGTDVCVQLYWL